MRLRFMHTFLKIATVLLLTSFIPHKYYVTIAEINYNSQQRYFETSIKFIGHDLEYVMEKEGHPELFLGTDKEHPKADSLLFHYIQQHFYITVNQKVVPIKYFGKEVKNDDDIIIYFTSEEITTISDVAITTTLFNQYFEEHVNIIYLTVGEERFNFRLNEYKTTEKHTIKNQVTNEEN